MNAAQYVYLLNNPSAVNSLHGVFLDKITQQFPFFQSARAIRLKNLYIQDSFHYNQFLRKTAAYTTDRNMLFEFITSENFASIQKMFFDEKEAKIQEIIVSDCEIIIDEKLQAPITNIQNTLEEVENTAPYQAQKLEKSIRDLISENPLEPYSEIEFVRKDPQPEATEQVIEKRLEIGKPLIFSQEEKHSFQEWLQLAKYKPINRTESILENTVEVIEINDVKQKKIDLIDKFIAANPKISSVKTYVSPAHSVAENEDNSSIMTETLAKVYLEQKKYQKAIQAYEILILKYPEKFSFFANRISDIKSLQQNNN